MSTELNEAVIAVSTTNLSAPQHTKAAAPALWTALYGMMHRTDLMKVYLAPYVSYFAGTRAVSAGVLSAMPRAAGIVLAHFGKGAVKVAQVCDNTTDQKAAKGLGFVPATKDVTPLAAVDSYQSALSAIRQTLYERAKGMGHGTEHTDIRGLLTLIRSVLVHAYPNDHLAMASANKLAVMGNWDALSEDWANVDPQFAMALKGPQAAGAEEPTAAQQPAATATPAPKPLPAPTKPPKKQSKQGLPKWLYAIAGASEDYEVTMDTTPENTALVQTITVPVSWDSLALPKTETYLTGFPFFLTSKKTGNVFTVQGAAGLGIGTSVDDDSGVVSHKNVIVTYAILDGEGDYITKSSTELAAMLNSGNFKATQLAPGAAPAQGQPGGPAAAAPPKAVPPAPPQPPPVAEYAGWTMQTIAQLESDNVFRLVLVWDPANKGLFAVLNQKFQGDYPKFLLGSYNSWEQCALKSPYAVDAQKGNYHVLGTRKSIDFWDQQPAESRANATSSDIGGSNVPLTSGNVYRWWKTAAMSAIALAHDEKSHFYIVLIADPKGNWIPGGIVPGYMLTDYPTTPAFATVVPEDTAVPPTFALPKEFPIGVPFVVDGWSKFAYMVKKASDVTAVGGAWKVKARMYKTATSGSEGVIPLSYAKDYTDDVPLTMTKDTLKNVEVLKWAADPETLKASAIGNIDPISAVPPILVGPGAVLVPLDFVKFNTTTGFYITEFAAQQAEKGSAKAELIRVHPSMLKNADTGEVSAIVTTYHNAEITKDGPDYVADLTSVTSTAEDVPQFLWPTKFGAYKTYVAKFANGSASKAVQAFDYETGLAGALPPGADVTPMGYAPFKPGFYATAKDELLYLSTLGAPAKDGTPTAWGCYPLGPGTRAMSPPNAAGFKTFTAVQPSTQLASQITDAAQVKFEYGPTLTPVLVVQPSGAPTPVPVATGVSTLDVHAGGKFAVHNAPDSVSGLPLPMHAITAPNPDVNTKKAGVVLVHTGGGLTSLITVVPLNHYGNVGLSLMRGGLDKGESYEQAAVRECFEESGYVAELVAHVGDFGGVRYFLGRSVGRNMHVVSPETAQVVFAQLKFIANTAWYCPSSIPARLRPYERQALAAALNVMSKIGDMNALTDAPPQKVGDSGSGPVVGTVPGGQVTKAVIIEAPPVAPKPATPPPEPKVVKVAKPPEDKWDSWKVAEGVVSQSPTEAFPLSGVKPHKGGSNPAWVGNYGGLKYRLKGAKDGKDAARSEAEAAAYRLARALGMPAVPTGIATHEGKRVTVQPMVDGQTIGADETLSADDMGRLLAQHAVDMWLGDHDGHNENWMRAGGRLVPIDRGQSFKFYVLALKAKTTYTPMLNPTFSPPGNVGNPVAKELLKNWAAGKTVIPGSAWASMRATIMGIEKFADVTKLGTVDPVANAAGVSPEDLRKNLANNAGGYLGMWTAALTTLVPDFQWPQGVSGAEAILLAPPKSGAEMGMYTEANKAVADESTMLKVGTNGVSVAIGGPYVENQEVLVKPVNLTAAINGDKVGTLCVWKFTYAAGVSAAAYIKNNLAHDSAKEKKTASTSAPPAASLLKADVLLNLWTRLSALVRHYMHNECRPLTAAEVASFGLPKPVTAVGAQKFGETDTFEKNKAVLPLIHKIADETKGQDGLFESGEPMAVVYAMAQQYLSVVEKLEEVLALKAAWQAANPGAKAGGYAPNGLEPIVATPFEYKAPAAAAKVSDADARVAKVRYYVNSHVMLPGISDSTVSAPGQVATPVYTANDGQVLPLGTNTATNFVVKFNQAPGVIFNMVDPSTDGTPRAFRGKCWMFMPGAPSPERVATMLQAVEEACGLTLKGATNEDRKALWLLQNIGASGRPDGIQPDATGELKGGDPALAALHNEYAKNGASPAFLSAATAELQSRLSVDGIQTDAAALDAQFAAGGFAREGSGDVAEGGTQHTLRAGWTRESLQEALDKAGLSKVVVAHGLNLMGSGAGNLRSLLRRGCTLYPRHAFQDNGIPIGSTVSMKPATASEVSSGASAASDVERGAYGSFCVFRNPSKEQWRLQMDVSLLLRADVGFVGLGDAFGSITAKRYTAIPAILKNIPSMSLSASISAGATPQLVTRNSANLQKYLRVIYTDDSEAFRKVAADALGANAAFYDGQSIEKTIK